jgi:class 3 adenylate cyclase/tetratricopeptide (TPR) repeat protein
MFCDMEGFTPLTESLGEEEAYSVMDSVYEILIHKVHDYDGTVNEMTGDGIMALFGAPVALEDAPQRAIRSSLAIHREMGKFSDQLKNDGKKQFRVKMRIGIHTGPVVVGTVGNDLRVEFKAVGDTVNLASRVEGQAQPGTTYVTEATFNLTEGLFRFEKLGQKQIKGKTEPVGIYRVIAPSTMRTRFDVSAERGLTPFEGRERELELLFEGLERSKTGRGQAISITAEAGLGKSRILYEFRKTVTSEDVTMLEGRCFSYARGVAYHPFIDILKANFDILEGDSDTDIRKKVEKGLKILNADKTSTLPYLLELLAVKDSGLDSIPMGPEAKKGGIAETFKQIIVKGSEIRPLILAFEDLHWIDKSSEELLKHVLETAPGARIFLIFTYRPDLIPSWGAKSYHSQIALNRLSNRESLMMVSHILGTELLDPDLEEFILEKTEGIPFYIEELIKSLNDLKIIEKIGNEYRLVKKTREVVIPSTIQDVITARIDSLPDQAKNILQTGSVLGREFRHELIKRVRFEPEQDLLSYLSILKDSELLYERGIYPNSSYIFKHALTQEVAYNGLLLKNRKEIHRKIGKAIEALYSDRLEEYYEILAYHYELSGNEDKAVDYLDLANRKAIKLSAMEEAKSCFSKAMALLDKLPDIKENRQRRISLLVNQVEAFMLLFETPDYYELLKRHESIAIALGDRSLLGAFYSRVGHSEFGLGNFNQAIRMFTKAVEFCDNAGNTEDAGFAYTWLGWSYLYTGEFEKVLEVKEGLLRTMHRQFNLRWYIRGLCAASRALVCLGKWEEALDTGEKALKKAEEFSDVSTICFAARDLSIACTAKGNLSRAIIFGEMSLNRATTPADKAWAQRVLGWSLCRAGDTDRGLALLTEALPIFRAGRWMPSIIPVLCTIGEAYWLAEEVDKARQTLQEVYGIAERCGAKFYLGWSERILGEVESLKDAEKAVSHLTNSIAVLQEIKAENELALAHVGFARFYQQTGKMEKAQDHMRKALKIFNQLGTSLKGYQIEAEDFAV